MLVESEPGIAIASEIVIMVRPKINERTACVFSDLGESLGGMVGERLPKKKLLIEWIGGMGERGDFIGDLTEDFSTYLFEGEAITSSVDFPNTIGSLLDRGRSIPQEEQKKDSSSLGEPHLSQYTILTHH